MTDIKHLIEMAERAAYEAGHEIMEIYQSGQIETEMKADQSPLTKADKKAHAIITNYLVNTNIPVLSEEGNQIAFSERKEFKYLWLIDPLDGTKEFINKNGEFTVNIALVERNKPVAGVIHAPCFKTLYSGSAETGVSKYENGKQVKFIPLPEKRQLKDLLMKDSIKIVASRSHLSSETRNFIKRFRNATLTLSGSSLKFMLVLEGRADIYPRLEPTMEWDTAAAHAILNASNRGVYDSGSGSELIYNKSDLHNPAFIAF